MNALPALLRAAPMIALMAALPGHAAEPLRVAPTPTGCIVIIDDPPGEYRVDGLLDGGASVSLYGRRLEPREQTMNEGCLSSFRVSPSYDGAGTVLELRPVGVEFSGIIRVEGALRVTFDRVVDLSPSAPVGADRFYRVGPGDVIQIKVYSHDDLTKEAIVGADGKINYSLLGDLAVAGRTPREIQDEITAALGKNYIVNPQVSVELKKYASQFVHVTGQVKNPQRIPLEGGTTLKDALAAAGGFAQEAGYTITVARRSMGADGRAREPEQMGFSRKEIELGLANLMLQPDDVVTVSEKDYFYIQGEVRKPSRYEITPGLTLYQGIALSEGLTDWADSKKVSLIRKVGGKTTTQVFNLKDIQRQKVEDIPLSAGDIVIVPKRFL